MPTYEKLPPRTARGVISMPRSKGTARPASANNVSKSDYVDRKSYLIIPAHWDYRPGVTKLIKGAR